MANPSISDFTFQINEQLKAHTILEDHLIHTRQVLDFTLNSDLADAKPSELHAQLVVISQLIEDAQNQNEDLQDQLRSLSQLQTQQDIPTP